MSLVRPRSQDVSEVDRWRWIVSEQLSEEPGNIRFTPKGGLATKWVNKTGAASVYGELVQVSHAEDRAVEKCSNPYVAQGFMYSNGVADGEDVWVVIWGMAEALLEDSTGAERQMWVRPSSSTAGRVIAQDLPGYEIVGDSITYTTGSTASGTIGDTAAADGSYLEIAEAVGTPGLDCYVEFTVDEAQSSVFFEGYYTGNHANSVVIQPYDYDATAWDSTILTLDTARSTNEELQYTGLGPQHFDSTNGKMRLRLYHSDAGNATHRVWVDKLVVGNTSSVEHFKEVGHSLQNVTAGTDKLVLVNTHFL